MAHCNTLQHTLQHTATHCNTLQHNATHCNTLQQTATHYGTLAPHCTTLQHTATHCNTLQHTAIDTAVFTHIPKDFWYEFVSFFSKQIVGRVADNAVRIVCAYGVAVFFFIYMRIRYGWPLLDNAVIKLVLFTSHLQKHLRTR